MPHSGQIAHFKETEACSTFPSPFAAFSYALATCSCSWPRTTAAEAEQAAAAEESELGPESYLAGYNPAEATAAEPAAWNQVSRQKLFKDYVNDKVTELGDGPKYGIMYMQALTHTNTSMPLAEAVVAAAKANRVPLIVDFNDALMSSEE